MTLERTLALIPLLPFLGFLLNGMVGKRLGQGLGRRVIAGIACAGPVLGFLFSVRLFRHLAAGGDAIDTTLYTWIAAGSVKIDVRLVCDQLTSVMLLVVTGVGSLIHIYSAEYMDEESVGGYARYYAYLNLFTAMMLVLITGASLPLLFVGWEGVGLCSYLLIGFWYQDTRNADAGRKAFIVNRVGDFGFLLGMFLLFKELGTLGIAAINQQALAGAADTGTLTVACLLLFVGACGKSAQIPLYVWLPDAMAGPTPVSALIHAATMVTAGVYMVARLGGLFSMAPTALAVVATVGTLTAFFAATMALPEMDLKKVLAYSTISQLGYMFLGVGTGVYAAGIFHLVTHAFFKALLFLGAGAVMHAFHHMDMRKLGGLKKKMPITFWVFLVGALALAGIPPFSGFFSKDEILGAAFGKFLAGDGFGWALLWLLGVVTAALTAFYTFRAVSMTFLGEPRGPADAHMHAHDPGRRIAVPLFVLAVLAALGGFLSVAPMFGGHAWLTHYLTPALGALAHEGGHAGAMWVAVALTTTLGLVGAYSGYRLYSEPSEALETLVRRPGIKPLHELVSAKYRVDELYGRVFIRTIMDGAKALWRWVDVAVIDNTVNQLAASVRALAEGARGIQAGYLNQYLFYIAGGAVTLLLILMG